jgi:hypothetical protein
MQKIRVANPQKNWLVTFGVCIGLLVAISLPSFFHAFSSEASTASWESILRGFIIRLPVAIPLVWLAIYAGRNYMLSVRLEEDYAYKEAISTAFEGYKREMEKIASSGDLPAPLTTLCGNVLNALADPPGRIYDGKNNDITPATSVVESVERLDSLRKRQIAPN